MNLSINNQARLPFQFQEVKEQFILNCLQKIKTSKAAGLDNMPPRLLKDSAHVIYRPHLRRLLTCHLNKVLCQMILKMQKLYPFLRVVNPKI